MTLVHLASRILGTPLLIARPKLDAILSVLGSRIGLPDREMAIPMPIVKSLKSSSPAGIAVIPVYGTLVKRSLGLEAASGLTSFDEIGAQLDAALNDTKIAGILLDMDSPGGEASGVFELANRIREANSIKPIWAHANDAAYSAAYAIAAASERVTLSQTAGVGSIGVIALHIDQTVKDANDGLAYTAIYAGGHKNDLSPHQPLTPQATKELQSEVDRLYGLFVTQVAQMRHLDPEVVKATEAAVYFGDNAVRAGLADAVMPFDQVLREFSDALSVKQRLSNSTKLSTVSTHAIPENTMTTTNPLALTDVSNEPPNTEHSIQSTDQPTDQHQVLKLNVSPLTTPTESQENSRNGAQAIAELCLLAGKPQLTAHYLASSMSESQVRIALLEARADQKEISSHINPDIQTTMTSENNPVIAAVKKLHTKE